MGHIARKVSSDAAFAWEVKLSVWCFISENFYFDLIFHSVRGETIVEWGISLTCSRIRVDDAPELFWADLRDKLHVSKGVIVTKISIEAAGIRDKFVPIFGGEARDLSESMLFELIKVLIGEVGLEYAPDKRLLIRNLVKCN